MGFRKLVAGSLFWKRFSGSLQCGQDPWWGAWSHQCPFLLETHPFLPFQEIFVLSHPGKEDSCYGKTHNGAGIVDAHTARPLTIMCFHQKDCNFQGDNINRQARGRERRVKACSLKFQSTRKALRVINKMAEKKQLHCWGGALVCSRRDMTRGRVRSLCGRVVWWTCSAPTEYHSRAVRWPAPSRRCALKWPFRAEPVYSLTDQAAEKQHSGIVAASQTLFCSITVW